MTMKTSGRVPDAPAGPGRVLYPAGPGPASVCWKCFQPRLDLAATVDRRVTGGELASVCGPCHSAALAGRPAEMPGRDDLPDLLRRWARWHINGEVTDAAAERMLATLLPGLTGEQRTGWFTELQAALLEVQDRTEPGFEMASVEPEARDIEALIAAAEAKADEAVEALMGGCPVSRYQVNEVVDVHLRRVRVVGEDAMGVLTVSDDVGDHYPVPPQAAVTRVAPAEWPPQPGDVWSDRQGRLHFASCYTPDYDDKEDSRGVDEGGVRVVLLPQYSDDTSVPGHKWYRPGHVLQAEGPMTLVFRPQQQAGGAA